MRLTSFTDYGLRALMRLAGAPDRSFTTEEIATEFRISRNNLTKVVQALSRAGYDGAARSGRRSALSKPVESISLGEVVVACSSTVTPWSNASVPTAATAPSPRHAVCDRSSGRRSRRSSRRSMRRLSRTAPIRVVGLRSQSSRTGTKRSRSTRAAPERRAPGWPAAAQPMARSMSAAKASMKLLKKAFTPSLESSPSSLKRRAAPPT